MITHDVVQGEEAWHKLRLGLPTASKFDKIVTPVKLQATKSSTSEAYMCQLLAEWIIGQPCDMGGNKFMERGTELEPDARKLYALLNTVKVDRVGFCTTDDGTIGCSPDGLIKVDGQVVAVGGLEIKCPMAPGHVKYLLDAIANKGQAELLYSEYRLQVQGSLFVTKLDWWDIVSYAPGMPLVVYRVEPEDYVQRALENNLIIFTQQLEIFKQRLIEDGVEPYEMIAEREQSEEDKEFTEATGFEA